LQQNIELADWLYIEVGIGQQAYACGILLEEFGSLYNGLEGGVRREESLTVH